MNTPAFHFFGFLLLACPAIAQGPPGGGYSIPSPKGIEWPAGLPTPSAFHDAYLGSFYGDSSPDAAVLGDARAYLIYDVEFQAAVFDVTPSGEAIAAFAPVEPDEDADPWGLAMAGDGGVWLHEHPGPAALIATGAPWNDLQVLRPANLDCVGKADLLGGAAYSVHLLHHDGSGWVSGAVIPLPGLLLDLVALDWNGDADDEFAVLTPYGLSVYESDGQMIDFFIGPASSGRIAAIPVMSGYSTARLAWAFPGGPTGLLLVCSPGGSRINCGAFPSAPAAIASGTFVDALDERRVDLITTAVGSSALRYFLHNAPGGNPYDGGSPDGMLVVGTTAPFGECRIGFRDITGDNIPDALFGRPGDGQVFFLAGAHPTFAGLDYPKLTQEPFIQPRMVLEPGAPSKLWFEVHLDLDGLPSSPDYTHVQIRAWHSEDGEVLDPAEVGNLLFSLTGSYYAPDPAVADAELRVAILTNGNPETCEFTGGYYFTMRLVTLENGRPNNGSASVTAGFTLAEFVADLMDPEQEATWFDLADCDDAPGQSLIKNPVWALLDPNVPPAFESPTPAQLPPLPGS